MKVLRLMGCLILLYLNSEAQDTPRDLLTENFVFSVQTIDDFFDRFNFDTLTPAFQFIRNNYPDLLFERKKIILSLFDRKDSSWNYVEVNKFATQFETNTAAKLSFEKQGWFSTLHCAVIYKNKRRKLDLIMQVDSVIIRPGSVGYKWTLRSIRASFIHSPDTLDTRDSLHTSTPTKPGVFLQPMSHAINFMNIDDMFRKNMTRSYFAKEASSPDLDTLVKLIDNSLIKFIQVDSVTYDIFQLSGWVIEVKNFDRLDNNSGWLISRLIQADEKKKKDYLLNHLNIR